MTILGIDIGTTSVKISHYDVSKSVKETKSKDTNATINCGSPLYHEQSVTAIFDAVKNLLDEFDADSLRRVEHIGISGQMHGVLFWNEKCLGQSVGLREHSNLITWMDQRCLKDDFVDFLPRMPSNLVSEMSVSTGYGCATIFHFAKTNPGFLTKWQFAGNIVDFLICQLCDIDRPSMSPQIAHSWGYYDLLNNCWFTDILNHHGFPIRFLPQIVQPGTVVGQTAGFLSGICPGASVYVGMGDLQCSMFAALSDNLNAAINFSTSSQFVTRIGYEELLSLSGATGDGCNNRLLTLPDGLVVNPFFVGNDYLLVAASLNGGNVLDHFASMLYNWVTDLAGIDVGKDKVWTHLTSLYDGTLSANSDGSCHDHQLHMKPILFGERHCPLSGGTVSNILPTNCSLKNVYGSICYNLVKNLTDLFPLELVKQAKVQKLTCCGSVINRHRCVKDSITEIYKRTISNIEFLGTYDACVGVVDYLQSIV